jgi:hypothetical protein
LTLLAFIVDSGSILFFSSSAPLSVKPFLPPFHSFPFAEFIGTCTPPLYLLREKGRDIRDQERDLQGQDINRDNRTSALSRYHGDSPSPKLTADTSRKSRETDRELERNTAERDRHSPRLKHSHGPLLVSDSQELLSYARGREFDRPLDANLSRRRDLSRDSGNEPIRGSERERDNMVQQHPHPLRERDEHSPQQPADDYSPELRVARPGDRLRSAEVTRPYEGASSRMLSIVGTALST